MKFINLYNKEVSINIAPYYIKWNDSARKISKPQKQVEKFLYSYWKSDVVLTEFKLPNSLCRLDLLNTTKSIAIEISPSSSHSYNKFFNKNRINFLAAQKREVNKQKWCELNNIILIELNDLHLSNLTPEMFKKEFNLIL